MYSEMIFEDLSVTSMAVVCLDCQQYVGVEEASSISVFERSLVQSLFMY